MAKGRGASVARRRRTILTGERLDWSLALAAIALGLLAYLLDDRTNWSGGFGFDGRFYGELAKNFGAVVFGNGVVEEPGLGPTPGPPLHGVTDYYAFRIFPSGVVWGGLEVSGLSPTNGHVIGLFAGLNALMFGLATFCVCRSAGLLGLGDRAKLLAATALVLNFAALKTGGYYPVLTDQVSLGLGALSLYLWLRGWTVGLFLCVLAACFTWPLHMIVGPLLLLFPPPENIRGMFAPDRQPEQAERASWRPAPFGILIGGVTAVATMAALAVFQLDGHRSQFGTEQLPVVPLSIALTGGYVFAVVSLLMPRRGLPQVLEILRSIRLPRLALAIGTLVVVQVTARLIAQRPGFDTSGLFKDALWSTTLDPGIFVVLLISYFGPVFLLLFADLPRVAADAWRLGPAMVAVLGAALLGTLTSQPREIVDVYAFAVLAGAIAAQRLFVLSWSGLAAFAVLSLALSRVWLHVGAIGTDLTKLQEFPAQRYYMTAGPWTPPSTYFLQLAAVACVAIVIWLVARRSRSGDAAGAH